LQNTKRTLAKKNLKKIALELTLFVADQITNGQISTNFAAKKYDVPRTTISYWIKKHSTLVQQNTGMSKLNEIKKLKERIAELAFVKNFQQDTIGGIKLIIGVDLSKKSLLKIVAKEIALKKKNRLKENDSIRVLGFVNKPSIKDVRTYKTKN
jgi:transposase